MVLMPYVDSGPHTTPHPCVVGGGIPTECLPAAPLAVHGWPVAGRSPIQGGQRSQGQEDATKRSQALPQGRELEPLGWEAM